jgi:hypothetical protein
MRKTGKIEITLGEFNRLYDRRARRHGWHLCDDEGVITAHMVIDQTDWDDHDPATDIQWQNDEDALARMVGMARRGSKMALIALWLDGKSTDEPHYLPPNLAPESDGRDESDRWGPNLEPKD